MEKWTKGMKCPRSVVVQGQVVKIKHVTQLKDGKYYMTTIVDLSGESGNDIMINAAYNMLIQDLRPRALKPLKSTEIDETKHLKPCDYPGNGGGVSHRDVIIRFLTEGGMTKAEAEKVADNPKGVETILRKNNVDKDLHTEG